MKFPKRSLLVLVVLACANAGFSQNSSLNVGFSFLGIKDSNPYGGGLHMGYEYQIPKVDFFALEARVGAGFLLGDGLYQTNPIREWDYKANYLMVGVIPRFYYRVAEELYLFLDPEIGLARISGTTYFQEQNRWDKTKTFNYQYYGLKVGVKVPISEKLNLSLSVGYLSMDITDLMNSNLSTISYRFKKQTLDFGTSFTFHVVL
jgi:hypothetical protein